MPADARLGDAPALQALREPTPHVDLVPRHVLQQDVPRGRSARARALAGAGGGAVLVHVALASAFFYLLSFRDAETPREIEIPVEVVREAPKPAAPPNGSKAAGAPGSGAPASPGPEGEAARPDAAAGAPLPTPPQPKPPAQGQDAKLASALSAPVGPPKAAGKPAAPAPSPTGETAPPKLIAPPPDAPRSATQDKENKVANLVPDERQTDQATREARPVAIPEVLTTRDPSAETAVPAPVKPPPAPSEKPAPPIPAKVPSATDRLAAALPMDTSAMPMSFRSVFAGNAAAQIKAAYAGVIQGRIRQAQAELSDTAYSQRLSGTVAVSFTIDDAGKLTELGIAQSSGNAKLDALALHAIELAAPFPAPPPEAEHTFNKAFLVGG